MNGSIQRALRRFTQATRLSPCDQPARNGRAPRSSVTLDAVPVGATETPVVAVEHDGSLLIALPYGERTDWMKNVLASGTATVVTRGQAYDVDRPDVIPMTDATRYFRPKEQKLHRRFAVETCFRVYRVATIEPTERLEVPPDLEGMDSDARSISQCSQIRSKEVRRPRSR